MLSGNHLNFSKFRLQVSVLSELWKWILTFCTISDPYFSAAVIYSKTFNHPSLFLVFISNSLTLLFSLYQQASDQGPAGDKNQKSKRIEEDLGEPAAKKANSKIQILPFSSPFFDIASFVYGLLTKLVRSRRLDVGQVLVF